jgi:apolipoprotein N-acyltransferase
VSRLRVTDRAAALAPLLAAAAGLALLVAHPPLGWWPTSFLAPPLLLAALWADQLAAADADRGVRAFRLGGLFGLVAFAPMLSWLIMPAGYVGWGLLVAVQVVWFGLLAVLMRPFLGHPLSALALAALWTGIDAWRAIVPLNGFEWGAIAYAHVDGSWMLPVARIVGGRGITFLVVLIGAAAAVVARATWRSVRERGDESVEVALRSTNGPIALLVGGLLVSVLATVEPPPATGSLDVLAVQGNDVRHWERNAPDPDPPLRIASALRDETLAAVARDGAPELTIWPESSLDRDPFTDRGAPLGALAGEAAGAAGSLLTGVTLDGPDRTSERYVAAMLLQDGLQETDRYVKRRLVPFGEYIPFRPLLDWFPPLDQIPRDTLPGEGPQTIDLPGGVRAAVIICFETKFMDIVRSNIRAEGEPAQILLTLTNDASFGDSAEPPQHLAQTRLRAVETGRWAVHAALAGGSAFVDPTGELAQVTELFTVDSIRAEVPLVDGLTPYLVIGDVVGWLTRLSVVLAAGAAVVAVRRGRPASESELTASGR